MTLAQSIFARHPGETDEAYTKRHREITNTFRTVLSTKDGHKLIHLLVKHRDPTCARFAPGRSNEEAAFLDGQMDVIATLMIHGTNLGISKPESE